MKKVLITLLLIAAVAATSNKANAQAFERHSAILSIGVGFSDFYHMDDYYYGPGPGHRRAYYSPRTGQFNFQMEFGISNYVGLGFTTGIGGRRGWNNDYAGEVNVPIGMICNFHFYQLIDDKSDRDIHADELDIYAGLSAGTGFAFTRYNNDISRTVPLAFGGPHVGLRWFFTEHTALNAEVGYGKSLVNLGFSFKL